MVAKSAIFADKDIVSKVVSGQLGTNKNKGVGNPEACWDHYTKCRDNNVKKAIQPQIVMVYHVLQTIIQKQTKLLRTQY